MIEDLRNQLMRIELAINSEGVTDYWIKRKIELMNRISELNRMECKK